MTWARSTSWRNAKTPGAIRYELDRNSPNPTWREVALIGETLFDVSAAALAVLSSDTGPELHMVFRYWDRLATTQYSPSQGWSDPEKMFRGVTGDPGLVVGRYGTVGDFEVTAPLTEGGIGHFWRDNDVSGASWNGPTAVFGSDHGVFTSANVTRSRYGGGRNLEVVAVQDLKPMHFYREAGLETWQLSGRAIATSDREWQFADGRFGYAADDKRELAGTFANPSGGDSDPPRMFYLE